MSITREDLDTPLQNWLDESHPVQRTVIVMTSTTTTQQEQEDLCQRTGAEARSLGLGGVMVLEVSHKALEALMQDPLVTKVEKPGTNRALKLGRTP